MDGREGPGKVKAALGHDPFVVNGQDEVGGEVGGDPEESLITLHKRID